MSRINKTLAMDRRRFLGAAIGGGALLAVAGGWLVPTLRATANAPVGKPGKVLLEQFGDDGRDLGAKEVDKLVLSDAQWRQKLAPATFEIMRHAGTEHAFSGKYNKPDQPGLFRCTACGTALYDAATEFHSGTGWPSFWQPIAAKNVIESRDNMFGMTRTAINCARCDSHLGHVFPDGPRPTGLRYCMNSLALQFVPRTSG